MIALTRILFFLTLIALPITLIKFVGNYKIYTLDLFLVPLAFLFIIAKLTKVRMKMGFSGPDKYVVLLFFFIVISFLLSGNRAGSMPNLVDWVRYLFIYMISRTLFESEIVKPKEFVNTWSWIGAGLLIVGLIQAITDTRFGLVGNYFGEGFNQGGTAAVTGNQVVNRVSGTSPNPNIYVMWITLFFGMVLVRAFIGKRYNAFILGVAIGGFTIVSTLARGGVAAFFLFVIILVMSNSRKLLDSRFVLTSVAAVVAGLAILVVGVYITELRFEQLADALMARVGQADAVDRVDMVSKGFEVIFNDAKVFIFGTGALNFPMGLIVHNMWVRLFAEHGVFTLLALLALSLSFYSTIRKFRLNGSQESRLWVAYLTSTLIPFLLISSQVYHTAGGYDIFIPLFVIISFIVSRQRVSEKITNQPDDSSDDGTSPVVTGTRILRRRTSMNNMELTACPGVTGLNIHNS